MLMVHQLRNMVLPQMMLMVLPLLRNMVLQLTMLMVPLRKDPVLHLMTTMMTTLLRFLLMLMLLPRHLHLPMKMLDAAVLVEDLAELLLNKILTPAKKAPRAGRNQQASRPAPRRQQQEQRR